MPHVAIGDPASAISIQPSAVVSRVIHRDEKLNVTVFGFDAAEGLTEHQTGQTAIIQVLSGRLALTVDGEDLDALPGFWLQMGPGTPHSLNARQPTIMLLTLIRP